MSRRHRAEKREITPDPKYKNEVVTKFMNSIMYEGKKSVAEAIVYGAFDISRPRPSRTRSPCSARRSTTSCRRSRSARGASAAPPTRCRSKCGTDRRQALAIRWLLIAARGRNEKTMTEKLSGELLDAANNRGNAVKKREDTHRMAEANRAFSHYRW